MNVLRAIYRSLRSEPIEPLHFNWAQAILALRRKHGEWPKRQIFPVPVER